ncbi:uncharacterized protein Z519_06570 [Cladophialophora bantiana CBS 173.52]|uniref:Uncharacterized protein n=1 Tax=Cladophialophora bantiana (strain ATCC 10958 / CBS 173.52 / CDC B-1940 / NIH 8579) TaxID=1442370 RepID=A0A0D2G1V7_CLAB1|nr:uncharacterized protein Z519_06570 [Cladophialophora bantiana CBS 173.52]KIW92722.1 hypothetical protein Z519_06570 [Cladophialophora bantiana CBS 173.52]
MANIDECAGPRISGNISIDLSSVPRFRYHENDKRAKNFSCSTAVLNAQRRSEWSLMACPVTQTAGIVSATDNIGEVLDPNSGTRYGMNTYMLYGVGQHDRHLGRWLNYCKRQMIFEDDDRGPIVSNLRLASEADYISRREWLNIPTNDPLVTFSLSLCYSAFNETVISALAVGAIAQSQASNGTMTIAHLVQKEFVSKWGLLGSTRLVRRPRSMIHSQSEGFSASHDQSRILQAQAQGVTSGSLVPI